ncbi:TRP-like family [Plasmopara halstedii]|uniref:TRP-like family n=1 Tax=Plasmopara halstedii TaxID=4781 RepID=A0A0P1ASP3_PLAHL|nr:TRP-like family [Plasmopara halstedii]CEG44118.1 TRP-like family [Plasmopara halstedii]|eukprot:XP_024580487.1 TRP-like family [Plasmopara halstedii]
MSPTTTPDSDLDDEIEQSNEVSRTVTDGSDIDYEKNSTDSDSTSSSSDTESTSATTGDSSEDSLKPSTPRSETTKSPSQTPTPTTKTPSTTTSSDTSNDSSDKISETKDVPQSSAAKNSSSTNDSIKQSTATNSTSTPPSSGSDDGRRLLVDAGETTIAAGSAGNSTVGSSRNITAARSPVNASNESADDAPTVPLEAPKSNSTSVAPTTIPATTTTSSPTTKSPPSVDTITNSTTKTPTTSTMDSTDLTESVNTPDTTDDVVTTNNTLSAITIEFSCDSTFYESWSKMGLTCGGTELDVMSAAASTECSIYSGTSSGTAIFDLATCMSVCRFPACHNGTWDYTASDGINSDIYANLDFITLMSLASKEAALSVIDVVQQPFSNLTFAAVTECDYTSDESFGACQCAGVIDSSMTSTDTSTSSAAHYSVPANKGLEDANHWPDGKKKSPVDKVGIASTTIGSSAATVSVVAGGVMSVASGIVGGTSASVASGVSAAASVGITMAAVDICQFSIMLTQMNVDARPRFMENMGKKMAPASFTFLPFGKVNISADDSSENSSRRLETAGSMSGVSHSNSSANVQGMEKYAALIGVDAGMLFYVAVAGIACMVAIVFGMYMLAMSVCYFVVKDFPTFSLKWLDKAIGVLMMILILSEYVVGATAMYQICYCIDRNSLDVSFFLAILTLLCLAFGTILYGVIVIKNNEDELRDLGTKDHFDKKFHNRYGPLYDEHSFEGRFFFAPKLLLALLCGMTTGMIWIEGLWQIVVLIVLHIAFLLYLEIKQPYPTAFVQKTSSFVIIIKISALFLSFFLLSSATSFTESIPDDLREGVAFAIVGLQVLVLLCLMIRQVYIFYRTWKLKRDGTSKDDKTVTIQTTNAREGSETFFALGGEPQYYGNVNQSLGGSLALLGDNATPKVHDSRHYSHETPSNVSMTYDNRPPLRGLQPQRTQSSVQHENHYRTNEVDL